MLLTRHPARLVGGTQSHPSSGGGTAVVGATPAEGEQKKETTTVIGEITADTDFTVRAGIRWTHEIRIDYDLTGALDKLAAKGGFLGALGKVGQFASGLTEQGTREYFVEVTCDIVGTPFDPSDKLSVEASLD